MSEWISVKDGLPTPATMNLVRLASGFHALGVLCNGDWDVQCYGIWPRKNPPVGVTHWMPLPAPPEVK